MLDNKYPGGHMVRARAARRKLMKSEQKKDRQTCTSRIYVFRCDESGLFAFTADRDGRMLPSQMYPQICWRFQHELVPHYDGDSPRDRILRATLDGIAQRGFHLVHAALYGDLLGI